MLADDDEQYRCTSSTVTIPTTAHHGVLHGTPEMLYDVSHA